MQMSHVDVCVNAVQENHLAQEGREPLEATVTASCLHTVRHSTPVFCYQCQRKDRPSPHHLDRWVTQSES